MADLNHRVAFNTMKGLEIALGESRPPALMGEVAPVVGSHSHSGEGALKIGGYDIEKIVNYAVIATSITAAAVVIAPLALPAMGIGADVEQKLIEECCSNITPHTGIAHELSEFINKIPVVGTYLNTADGKNILVPAAAILGGYTAGSLVSDMEKERGGEGTIGAAIRTTSLALGVVLSLPALLPGIAHGLLFIGRMTGVEQLNADGDYEGMFSSAAKMLGTNACAVAGPAGSGDAPITQAFASVEGMKGAGSLLAGHAGCFIPALLGIGSASAHAAGTYAEQIEAERIQAENAVRKR